MPTNKNIRVMMVDDEPLIRKVVKMEMNARAVQVESGDVDGSVMRRVEMVDTFASGPSLMAALESVEAPDYVLVDMEFQGEPTGGIFIADRVHKKYPNIKIAILSGRFDNPLPNEGNRLERMLEIARVVFEALQRGACAFVSKNAAGGFSVENVLRAIECLERGEKYYFNYPVMLTLKEAAELYVSNAAYMRSDLTINDTERQLLLLEAAGCTAAEIATALHETDKNIQERQKELSRKLDIVNKSGARIAKALQYGLIDAKEIHFLKR